MKVKIKLLIICLFIVNYLFSADVDVNLTIPEDYGIDFPSALHLDRLYFAVEGENGNLELLTESDLNIGVATSTFGSVNLCLLYYGNLANPYAVQLVVDAGEGFILLDSTQAEFTIPISPVVSQPQLTNLTATDVLLSAEENKADLVINPIGPIQGERVVDIALNWNGGRELLPGLYTADVSMMLISE